MKRSKLLSILFYIMSASAVIALISCTEKRDDSAVIHYESDLDQTTYSLQSWLSYKLPGRWIAQEYDEDSQEQFFLGPDSTSFSISITHTTQYRFNKDKQLDGIAFVRSYYDLEATFIRNKLGMSCKMIEIDSVQKFIIYEVSEKSPKPTANTYILVGVMNQMVSNYSIFNNYRRTEHHCLALLKMLYCKHRI